MKARLGDVSGLGRFENCDFVKVCDRQLLYIGVQYPHQPNHLLFVDILRTKRHTSYNCLRQRAPPCSGCHPKSNKTLTGPAGKRPTCPPSASAACPTTPTYKCSRKTTAPNASSAHDPSPSSAGKPTAPPAKSALASASPARA